MICRMRLRGPGRTRWIVLPDGRFVKSARASLKCLRATALAFLLTPLASTSPEAKSCPCASARPLARLDRADPPIAARDAPVTEP